MRIGPCSTALGVLMLAAATPVIAQAQTAAVQFRVPAGPLQTALPLFAAQSGEQILYSTDLVAGRQSPGVNGALGTDQALTALLQGTGLRARRTSSSTLVVFDPTARAEATDEAVEIAEVIVTGSLIRGVADGPSPVITVTRDDIDRQGHGTVAQALAALPQNFGGTANEGALQNGADRSASNGGFASGVNLRGLGSDATLVLINGRRLSGTGAFGDFADVSTVPTSAVSRIDVLLDGASALYGSDAVGGVVNIILRRDYDGAETRARYGQTGDGATREYQFGQTVGRLWSSGGLMGSYEYNNREPLAVADRPLAGNADLRPLGGSDRRLNYANPGNLVAYNAALGGYVSAYAIPEGQNGRNLRPSDFLAGQTNRSNQRQGMNVLPRQERHSLYLTGHQDLGSRLTLSADTRWGRREWETVSAPIVTLITATPANPFFVSPTLSLILYGGNADLKPEEADTWTAGVEYRPAAIDGLRLGLNWFRTDFDQRIGQPALNSVSTVLTDPALASFVRLINPVTNAEDRAAIQAWLDLPSTVTGGYPATAFGAIVDARYVNTTRVEVEGLDANLDYPFSLRGEAFQVSANLSYLDRFESQNTPGAPVVSTLNRPNEPIGLRGRGTLRWSRGPWTASTSANFVDSYRDFDGDRIGSWVTADAQIAFAPEHGALAGTTIALNVQNAFDRDPPFWDGLEGIAYDAANANVLGRFVSVQLTKAW